MVLVNIYASGPHSVVACSDVLSCEAFIFISSIKLCTKIHWNIWGFHFLVWKIVNLTKIQATWKFIYNLLNMPNVISILISYFQMIWPRLPWRRIFGTTKSISNIGVFTNVLFLLLVLELRTWCIPPQTGNGSVLFACKQCDDTLIETNRTSIYKIQNFL